MVGGVDGPPAAQARPVRPRLDGIFWHLGLLPTDPGTRPLDSPTHPHVLLEAVAAGAHQSAKPAGPRDGQTPRDPHGAQQQELLAIVADAGDADRDDECLACEPGVDLRSGSVDESPRICLIHCVLHSREPPSADPHARWCGEGGLETRPYPIMLAK